MNNQIRAPVTRRRLSRFGDAREFDGPLNAHQKFTHISDDLRWTIVAMSEIYSVQRSVITHYTSVSSRTVNRILQSWRTFGGVWGHGHGLRRRGSLFDHLLDDDHRHVLRNILKHRPVSYVDELVDELFFECGVIASKSAITRVLLDMGYSRRRLSRLSHKADVVERIDFRERAREWVFNLDQLIFIDETSKDRTSINRAFGWGPKRQSIYNKGFVLNGHRVSVVGAYSLSGIISMDYTQDTYDRCEFQSFFRRSVIPALQPFPQKHSIVVIDNARIHSRRWLISACKSVGAIVLFLSRYSPDLNPIEHVWAMMKRYLHRHGGHHLGNDNNQQLLLDAIDYAHINMDHIANFASCGWVLDPEDGCLDRWVRLSYDD